MGCKQKVSILLPGPLSVEDTFEEPHHMVVVQN